MRKQLRFLIFIFCAVVVLFPVGIRAEDRPLKVGVTIAGPPIEFKHRNQWEGLEIDLARELGRHLDRPVEFVELHWEKQIPALRTGEIDIIMAGMSVTRLRQLQISFAEPYLKIGQMGLIRKENESDFKTADEIIHTSKRVGSIEQTTGDFLTNKEFPAARHRHFKTADQGAAALKKKKIDIFITDSPYVKYYAGENDDLAAVPILLTEENLAWGVRKDNKSLLAEANQFLQAIKASGRFKELLETWGL